MIKITDGKTGAPLFTAELPEGFTVEAGTQILSFPEEQRLYLEINAKKDSCVIRYNTGELYYFERRPQQSWGYMQATDDSERTPSGAIRKSPVTLWEEVDGIASGLTGKQLKAKQYFNLPDSIIQRLRQELTDTVNDFVRNAQTVASFQQVPVGMDLRSYLLDGGMGLYQDGNRAIAVCLSRIGIEYDIVQRQGVMENLSGMPFGQAGMNPYVFSQNCEWSMPFVSYMVSTDSKDLEGFMGFMETVEETKELRNYQKQLKEQVTQYQLNKARNDAMQNQAMWGMMFAQQQQQFAAMDRLTNSISRDLDSFHNNLNAQMQQNDMRINTTPQYQGGESLDDRIQRGRHEATMGVETYEREDGSTVEFDNRAERVFESNLDNTDHFGTHNYFDDYVPDGWHELNKK
ncbi:MAG: hypothetical protein IKE18_04390 [Oscillospiraceae bacterium]|nr:hypothetical protein [Oscillospiraceae bacterium]